MSSQFSGENPLAYIGISQTNPGQNWFRTRAPTASDYAGYSIGDRWIDSLNRVAWSLVDKDQMQAYWISGGGAAVSSVVTDSGTASPIGGAVSLLGYGGSGVSTSASGGTIYVNSTGSSGGMTWSVVSTSGILIVNTGIICTGGAALSFALPATSAVGNIIAIGLDGSTSWTITQGSGQSIRIGGGATTTGAGGSIASTSVGDYLELVCEVANTRWFAKPPFGDLTVV
jgi:hypothetical protein